MWVYRSVFKRNEAFMKTPVKFVLIAAITLILLAGALAVVGCKNAKPDTPAQLEKDVEDAESPVAPIEGD